MHATQDTSGGHLQRTKYTNVHKCRTYYVPGVYSMSCYAPSLPLGASRRGRQTDKRKRGESFDNRFHKNKTKTTWSAVWWRGAKTDLDNVLHPCRHALERLPVGYVVNQHKTLRALEKARRQRVKPLLPCRVPDLRSPDTDGGTHPPIRERKRKGYHR